MKTQVGKAILSFFSWTLKKKIVKNESRISERSGKEVVWRVKVNNSRTPNRHSPIKFSIGAKY